MGELSKGRSARPGRRRRRMSCGTGVVLVGGLALGLLTACGTAPRTFVVDTTADAVDVSPGDGVCQTEAGECSLRAAVMEANAWAQPDGETIVLQPSATYPLSIVGPADDSARSGDLDLQGPAHVQGQGATIDASATGERVLHVPLGAVDLAQVTLTGGHADYGAGILAAPGTTTTLDGVTLAANTASERGGGLFAAQSSGTGATVAVASSTIESNTAVQGGGGVAVEANGSLNVGTTTFSDNVACPATCASQSWGGGIYSDSPVTVTTSAFTGNRTPNGSGSAIYVAQTTLALSNSTVTGGTTFDGSVRTWEGVTSNLEYVTISGNAGVSSGFHAGPGAVATITASIIGAQTSGTDCGGGFTLVDGGYNVSSGTTCGFTVPTDRQNVDPKLYPLAANGGPTRTMKPAVYSSAADLIPAGQAGCGTTVTADQRGTVRPQRGGCDAGALEITFAEAERAYTGVAAGDRHTCGLVGDGTARCWGSNTYGRLGDGTATDSAIPVTVTGLTGATAVASGGNHTCALLGDGTVRCWGWNYFGQLGDGTTTDSAIPVTVTGVTGATAVASGGNHTCALLGDGTVRCWGNNGRGQLGDGTTTASASPVAVTGLTGATAIAAGRDHTCAVISDGSARCWGDNYSGQLGNGTVSQFGVPTPVTVTGLTGAIAISARGPSGGGVHTCALLSDGSARCWGENGKGQLGDGTVVPHSAPVPVLGLAGATAIAAGDLHTCATLGDGTVRCWGTNLSQQLGIPFSWSNPYLTFPAPVTGLTEARALASGGNHTCALVGVGTVRCWGSNQWGQLGDGTTAGSSLPVQVLGP